MRLDLVTRERVVVTLSRRNLLTLLAKLAGFPPNSACTIVFPGTEGPTLEVHAEPDEAHYATRPSPPGTMHPNTEALIRPTPQRQSDG
jgi:hypothetical protein